jgi:hypothetical protein
MRQNPLDPDIGGDPDSADISGITESRCPAELV